jgi:short-subunit dehydrogenase
MTLENGAIMDASRRVALVTGASSGLGAALVAELVERGEHVVAVGRDRGRLEAVAARAGGDRVTLHICDLGRYDEVVALVRKTLEGGPVRYLFHSAGAPAFARPSDIDDELLKQALSASLCGLVYLSSLLVGPMKEQGTGSIVGILSTAALTGRPDEGAYAAAKWGCRGFLECLRADCKKSGVKVISVYPGGMNTAFWSKQSHLDPDLSTYMEPREVARPIVDAAMGIGTLGFVSSLTIERQ